MRPVARNSDRWPIGQPIEAQLLEARVPAATALRLHDEAKRLKLTDRRSDRAALQAEILKMGICDREASPVRFSRLRSVCPSAAPARPQVAPRPCEQRGSKLGRLATRNISINRGAKGPDIDVVSSLLQTLRFLLMPSGLSRDHGGDRRLLKSSGEKLRGTAFQAITTERSTFSRLPGQSIVDQVAQPIAKAGRPFYFYPPALLATRRAPRVSTDFACSQEGSRFTAHCLTSQRTERLKTNMPDPTSTRSACARRARPAQSSGSRS